ncbi:DUF6795 domain-containing protein [Microbulbifer litoralis]|uniref:DUF6795 domain-containing protein n=1 Tax=Microbulbifer litoralis TaxID=2933965 RepID=UPI002027E184|nr:DUF6795 domain-containing protein [Microbulbifer sp. GX H0434]
MSLIKTKEVDAVLFSEMSGIITYNGEPAEDVVLDLSVKWNEDQSVNQKLRTNSKGEFSIPKIEKRIETSPLVQLVISQTIVATYKGVSYDLWIRSKRDTNEYTETEGKPKNFRCELTDPLIRIEVESGQLGTPCKWEIAD